MHVKCEVSFFSCMYLAYIKTVYPFIVTIKFSIEREREISEKILSK